MIINQRGRAILDAIGNGLKAGADDTDWDAPEMREAVRLTDSDNFGDKCIWDFSGWRDAADCIRTHGKLGGVDFALPKTVVASWAAGDWDERTMTARRYSYRTESGGVLTLTNTDAALYTWGDPSETADGGEQGGAL